MYIDYGAQSELVFSSGRRVYVNNGEIALGESLYVGYGSDGGVDDAEFTPDERVELAKFMIDLWSEYMHRCVKDNFGEVRQRVELSYEDWTDE